MEEKICTKCIMDTSDKDITFDENGICSNCRSYEQKIKERVFTGKEGKQRLQYFVDKIKEEGKDKKYDCIIGLSGGVDSSYLAYYAVKNLGLRPLAVHMDNGWNTQTATRNINKIVRKLGIDLYTYVIDWEEFKDFQLSYLKAGVIDIEALTDHAIKAVLYKKANEENIKYILSGVNLVTEGILPLGWRYNKGDARNITSIHNLFGEKKLKTFPLLPIRERIYYQMIKKIREIEVLNYIDYNKNEVKKLIMEELGWGDYGVKHGESFFTRFYQNYILPKKFGIDKRKAHLSTLICSGQINREEALAELQKPPMDSFQMEQDKEYVLKKFDLSEEEFDKIMKSPIKSHYDYPNSDKLFKSLRKVYLKFLRK